METNPAPYESSSAQWEDHTDIDADPNLLAADDEDQLQPQDSLMDTDLEDVLDRGIAPPDRAPHIPSEGHRTLEERLLEEEPESVVGEDDEDYLDDREVGSVRAGRLVHSDQRFGDDTADDMVAVDVGIDGAAASAEEAAMHIVDFDDEPVG